VWYGPSEDPLKMVGTGRGATTGCRFPPLARPSSGSKGVFSVDVPVDTPSRRPGDAGRLQIIPQAVIAGLTRDITSRSMGCHAGLDPGESIIGVRLQLFGRQH